MPDADHAPAFWADVANTFLDDDGVILEPYNEPYPDGNRDSDAAWACWRDGCTANLNVPTGAARDDLPGRGHAGDGRRDPRHRIDARHPAGRRPVLERADAVAGPQAERSPRPARRGLAPLQLQCVRIADLLGRGPAAVAAAVPMVATEIGQDDCMGGFITPLMQWLDAQGAGYLAWSWNADGACMPGTDRADVVAHHQLHDGRAQRRVRAGVLRSRRRKVAGVNPSRRRPRRSPPPSASPPPPISSAPRRWRWRCPARSRRGCPSRRPRR